MKKNFIAIAYEPGTAIGFFTSFISKKICEHFNKIMFKKYLYMEWYKSRGFLGDWIPIDYRMEG
jgi:hypothetical protein